MQESLTKELKARFGTNSLSALSEIELHDRSLESMTTCMTNLEDYLNLYVKYAPSEAKAQESTAARDAVATARAFLSKVETAKQNTKTEKAILMSSLLICTRGGGVLKFDRDAQKRAEEMQIAREYTYYDINRVSYTYTWDIIDEIFLNSNALTLNQITTICNAHNPGLAERGFDIAIYEASQYYKINPKILLATLQWEQSWCKPLPGDTKDKTEARYSKAFGVVSSSQEPISFSGKEAGGVMNSCRTYVNSYKEAKEFYVNEGDYIGEEMLYNYDPDHKDMTAKWAAEHKDLTWYIDEGQMVKVVNAAMFARYRYNPWVYFPPFDLHSTKAWHDTVMNDFEGY